MKLKFIDCVGGLRWVGVAVDVGVPSTYLSVMTLDPKDKSCKLYFLLA